MQHQKRKIPNQILIWGIDITYFKWRPPTTTTIWLLDHKGVSFLDRGRIFLGRVKPPKNDLPILKMSRFQCLYSWWDEMWLLCWMKCPNPTGITRYVSHDSLDSETTRDAWISATICTRGVEKKTHMETVKRRNELIISDFIIIDEPLGHQNTLLDKHDTVSVCGVFF